MTTEVVTFGDANANVYKSLWTHTSYTRRNPHKYDDDDDDDDATILFLTKGLDIFKGTNQIVLSILN